MNEPQGQIDALFGTLRNVAAPDVFAAIETLVSDSYDRAAATKQVTSAVDDMLSGIVPKRERR